jgi:hypothetical protein
MIPSSGAKAEGTGIHCLSLPSKQPVAVPLIPARCSLAALLPLPPAHRFLRFRRAARRRLRHIRLCRANAVNNLAFRLSDVLGTKIYGLSPTHGFLYCVIAMTVTSSLMLPTLLFVPRELISTSDGQSNPALDAELLSELAESPAT